MRWRGFAWMNVVIVLAAGAALIAAIWGGLAWHAGVHFAYGEAAMKLEWEKANRKAEEEAELQRLEVETAIAQLQARAASAEARARAADNRWKEAVRESRRNNVALAVCEPSDPGPMVAAREEGGAGAVASDPVGGLRRGAPRVLLTWQFVHDFDAAWTGLAGEPVPGAPDGRPGSARAGAASPYGPDDVREVHGENARRCSEDRRELAALIGKIEAAAAAWGEYRTGIKRALDQVQQLQADVAKLQR